MCAKRQAKLYISLARNNKKREDLSPELCPWYYIMIGGLCRAGMDSLFVHPHDPNIILFSRV